MLPIVIADVDMESSLIAMCNQTEILLNCVGPVRTKMVKLGCMINEFCMLKNLIFGAGC